MNFERWDFESEVWRLNPWPGLCCQSLLVLWLPPKLKTRNMGELVTSCFLNGTK